MSDGYVYDYSSARPDPAALGLGVMRYLAPVGAPWPTRSVGKVVGLDELASLHTAGKPVGLVWEITANDSDGGYLKGLNYGAQARTMAQRLSFPDELPIYWAVDKRLNANTRALALDYGKGFTVSAGIARPYGEGALIDMAVGAGITDCGWCPSTWTMGSPNIGLLQLVQSPDVPGTDMNRALRPDWGGYLPGDSNDVDIRLSDDDIYKFKELLKRIGAIDELAWNVIGDKNNDGIRTMVADLVARPGADVAALAAALAPLLAGSVGHLTDPELAAIAGAVNDESARRQQA